ncbi:hypothetical protein Q5752_001971 [Cryptotrichosporon argae]
MTRGRPRDLSLPPSRVLENQRNYRDRRAARLKQLEIDNDSLTVENAALRARLEETQRYCVELEARQTRGGEDEVVRAAQGKLADALALLDQLRGPSPQTGRGGVEPSITAMSKADAAQAIPSHSDNAQLAELAAACDMQTLATQGVPSPEPAIMFELDASKCCFGAVECP